MSRSFHAVRADDATEGHALVDTMVAASLLAVVVVLGTRFAGIAFLGWDAYPILAASRAGSAGDLLALLGQPLAGGLLPMSFYRPLLSLSIAFEWPLWGLFAGGYVAVNAALFGLCGLALYRLLLRLGGSRGAARAAVLFFALHPVVPDVVPYLPRRPELLCTLFVLLALHLDHHGRFAPAGAVSRASIVGSMLATALAAGAKETAAVLPILIAAARWLFPAPAGSPLRQALRGLVAHAAVLTIPLWLRLHALGGLGGYPDTDVTRLADLWLRTVAKTLLGLFLPPGPTQALTVVGFAVLALGLVLIAGRRMQPQEEDGRAKSIPAGMAAWIGPDRMRLTALGGIWILALATVYAAGARLSPWYLLIAACGAAIGFGAAIDVAVSSLRARTLDRPPAVAAVLGGTLLLASFAAGSPIFRPAAEYRQASRDSAAFLGALEQRIRQTPAGGRIDAGRYPRLVIGPGGRQVPVLVPHSLAGWARISFPERRIDFVASHEFEEGTASDGVTVVTLTGGIHRDLSAERAAASPFE